MYTHVYLSLSLHIYIYICIFGLRLQASGLSARGGIPQHEGEHKPGRIKPGRIKRAALSLQNQHYYICCFLIRPRLYASDPST